MNYKSIEKFIFLEGKIKQWKKFQVKNFELWIAGINKYEKFEQIKKNLNENIKKLDKNKILKILGNQFGIIIIHNYWVFLATDYIRSYPIFWKIKKKTIEFSPQADLIKTSKDKINKEQLQAYRMSGYTTNHKTLWENIYNLKSGSYLICDNKLGVTIKQYFLYQPWKIKNKKFSEFKIILKKELNKLFNNIIKEAKGRRIIVPLSAGLDSRLIISGLKKYNYENVKCFSYGLKNNFESLAAEKIAKKLGYEWKFVKINYKISRKFFTSKTFTKYLKIANDGINVPVIHSIYAIHKLLKDKYIRNNDIIINGNSGDFISGGHIPKSFKYRKSSNNLDSLYNRVFDVHLHKHYSLWKILLNKKNKSIIRYTLFDQLLNSINSKNNLTEHGILELLEYENRQTKHVINGQRIYDYYKLDWLLPLWNISFIKFWQGIPLKYKLNQNLYKKVLFELNFGEVWTNEFNIKPYLSPKWIIIPRLFAKALFIFSSRDKWHEFESRYIDYWTAIMCDTCIHSYIFTIRNNKGFRNALSWLVLRAEKLNTGDKWQ